jgi:nucleotide-binding universal stress UspA family protein
VACISVTNGRRSGPCQLLASWTNAVGPHREREKMTNEIVVGVDGSPASAAAVRWAAGTASARNRPLLIVHGLDTAALGGHGNPYLSVPGLLKSLEAEGHVLLQEAREIAHKVDHDLDLLTALSPDSPSRLLVELADTAYAVVVGRSRTRMGAVDIAVTSHADGEVVVVPQDSTFTFASDAPVVVGIDGSPISEDAIAAAFEEASMRRAPLTAVHVWSDLSFGVFAGRLGYLTPPEEFEQAEAAIVAERLAGWQEKYPDVVVTRKIYMDGAREHLTKLSETARLVVVGSRGRGGFRGLLLGSTSNFVVRHSHCPVMVVRPRQQRYE